MSSTEKHTTERIEETNVIMLALQEENARLKREVAQWKNNHACEVGRARVLKDRIDMPLERTKAYDQIGKLQTELAQFNEKLIKCELMLSICQDSPTDKFRHYLGGIYTKICEGKLESDSTKIMVIYQSDSDGTIWIRPKEDFYGSVQIVDWEAPRFVSVNN
jgi:hypothetical protein